MQTKLFLLKKVVEGSQNHMQSEMLQGTRLNSSQRNKTVEVKEHLAVNSFVCLKSQQ